MLVLNRKADQFINIGADIEVHIINLSSNRVRIGIKAPKHVRIVRGELKEHTNSNQEYLDEIESPDAEIGRLNVELAKRDARIKELEAQLKS